MSIARYLFLTFIAPRSQDESTSSAEFILNVLLASFIIFLFFAILISLGNLFLGDAVVMVNGSIGTIAAVAIFVFFAGLLLLSRRSYVRLSSYLMVASLYLLAAYLGFRWSVELPAAMLFYALAIVVAGIVLDASAAFGFTLLSGIAIGITAYAQQAGMIAVNTYWMHERWGVSDTLVTVSLLGLIAVVSWLWNREIGRSLARTQRSEVDLLKERDLLEERVQQRTEELRMAEIDRLNQTYRFVEFGRLAGGLVHDLTNPLAALSLTISSIAASHEGAASASDTLLASDVDRAQSTTAYMQQLVESLRRHLVQESPEERFSVAHLLHDVAQVLSSYAKLRSVQLRLERTGDATISGNPISFTQVLTNLVSNAIEAFPQESVDASPRVVSLSFERSEQEGVITIRDTGPGIEPERIAAIFEPFVSSKRMSGGLGIGLSLAKRTIEKEFCGTLIVESAAGAGTTFIVQFPLSRDSAVQVN